MKLKTGLLIIFVLFFFKLLDAQDIQRKTVTALRINNPLKIDAILDEPCYNEAQPAKDFLQLQPYNGQPSFKESEVKIFYDDEAIYFGAMLYDNPDSITSYITTRDDIGASDYFDVFIDPNNEGLTAYEFIVTPANSQTDIKAIKTNGDSEDGSWDAVWQSSTKINDKGWAVEMKIPYSALRFPVKDVHVWGLNFFRNIKRYHSNNSWNLINFSINGFIQQSGQLYGLSNIKAPVRLSLSPYIAGYVENKDEKGKAGFYFKGGLDLKYGISESHTLDMMLIPDFGQIQSDDQQLNLTPYELYYDEKRQFFVEGTELFNRANVFYSRRIGAKPKFSYIKDSLRINEYVKYNPTETQIVNATKISGRDKNGWGVGFLNAMTLAGRAEIVDTITGKSREIITQNFTNFNVSVIEKALANNSYVSLINTNVSIFGDTYVANVTGTEFNIKNKKQEYQISGSASLSYKSEAENKTGYNYNVRFDKVKGKFRFYVSQKLNSDTYDANDLGYVRRNNDLENEAQVSYYEFNPFWIFKDWYINLNYQNTRLYKPAKHIQDQLTSWMEFSLKNNMWFGLWGSYNFASNDYFETRVSNRYYKGSEYYGWEFNCQTDQSKKLSGHMNIGRAQATFVKDESSLWSNLGLWWKVTERFGISYNFSTEQQRNLKGYVDHKSDSEVYFGLYDRYTYSNTISTGYNFSTKMSLNLRCRHYWSVADYKEYYFLNSDGSITNFNLTWKNADVNYNAFNIDMTFKWEFAPGSEISLAWKNSIQTENNETSLKFSENIKKTFMSPQDNSLSLKVLYYIDYNSLRKKKV